MHGINLPFAAPKMLLEPDECHFSNSWSKQRGSQQRKTASTKPNAKKNERIVIQGQSLVYRLSAQ